MISEPGKGSTFSFTLPVYGGETDRATETSIITSAYMNEGAPKQNGNSLDMPVNGECIDQKHILVVDDEPVNLKVLKNHLEHAGYGVTLAKDGHEALAELSSGKKFHLVLLI